MADKSVSDVVQAQDKGYDVDESEAIAPPINVPMEGKTVLTSVSPPPLAPAATKPSTLSGQSTTNSGIISSQAPGPEARRATDTATFQNEPRDPQVASLKTIFPDCDETILQSVLESVDRDQDRAVDLLLEMSDPNFKSEAPPPAQQPQMTQEDLDEQLARRLMLEEQQQAQHWQQQSHPHRRSSRVQGQSQQQPQQMGYPPVGGKDTMTEIQEQISKYAEIGKRNFGTLVSKVKAKIQEFDKPDTGGNASGTQSTWSGARGPSYYDPNTTRQSPPRTNYQPYQGHHATSGVQNPPLITPTNTAISQPLAFYDPNPSPQPVSPSPQFTSPVLSGKSGKKQSLISVEGYEVEPAPSSTGDALVTSSPSATSQTAAASSASVPPRGPSPANLIDGGKLGLLPKRPISLIRDPPQTQPPAQRHDSDDDVLEYAENPFDDDRK